MQSYTIGATLVDSDNKHDLMSLRESSDVHANKTIFLMSFPAVRQVL